MGDHYKTGYQGQPDDATPDTLYTVPDNYSAMIKDFEVFPFDGSSSDSITVWLVPDGDSPADENVWVPTQTLEGLDRIEWEGSKPLQAGYTIVAQSGSGGILNVMIGLMEVDETAA